MVKWQLRRKAVANVAAAINDAGNGSTSSGETGRELAENAAAALERALFISVLNSGLKDHAYDLRRAAGCLTSTEYQDWF